MNSTMVNQSEKDQYRYIVYWYSPLTSPFSFNPLMDFEFHHWALLKRMTTDNIKRVSYEVTPLNWVHVTNILHTATGGMAIYCMFPTTIIIIEIVDLKPGKLHVMGSSSVDLHLGILPSTPV